MLVSACSPLEDDEHPTVKYLTVDVRPQRAHVDGTSVAVEIELEVTSRMPHVAPHVNVAARCDGQHDEAMAFFMDLSKGRPGDRKVDTVELFGVSTFAGAPAQCELTLTLSKGATPPARYCWMNGRTRPGTC